MLPGVERALEDRNVRRLLEFAASIFQSIRNDARVALHMLPAADVVTAIFAAPPVTDDAVRGFAGTFGSVDSPAGDLAVRRLDDPASAACAARLLAAFANSEDECAAQALEVLRRG